MRLPVIQTCGECGHRNFNLCDNSEAHPPSGSYRIDADASPPTWCPLRTGPDAERIEALEAVASAVRDRRQCADHAGGCCAEWCTACRAELRTDMRMSAAMDRLDECVERDDR